MTDRDVFQTAKRIFGELIALDHSKRESALAALEVTDEVRAEVRALLGADVEATLSPEEFAARPPVDTGIELPGFRVVRLIGSGGMGQVFEAEQERPRRRVAIKLLRPELATGDAARRFDDEIDALGRLSHPGIAQIYETRRATTALGECPVIVLEYIEGLPLDAHARRGLTTEDAVRLIASVARAVQHAHGRGIVHRDLKPANILVTESGDTKLVDFGIAKLTEEARASRVETEAGQFFGTLAYMSPEQVSGDPTLIDVRTDVHALGVILYELLCGTLPFPVDPRAPMSALRAIAEHTPPRPRKLAPDLPNDLEAVILHALEKDPARRYPSASEMAADLERILRREPIGIRPPSGLYTVRLFARRHPALTSVSALALLILVTSSIALSILYRRSEQDRQLAVERQEQAERRLNLAVDATTLITETICRRLPEILGNRELQRDLLEVTAQFYERLEREAPREFELRHGIAKNLMRLGESRLELGEFESAAGAVDVGLALAREAAADPTLDDDQRYIIDIVLAYGVDLRARLAIRNTDFDVARDAIDEMLRIARRLIDSGRDDLDARQHEAFAIERRARLAWAEERREDSTADWQLVIDKRTELESLDPDDLVNRNRIAVAHDSLGQFAQSGGDLDAAERHYRAALAITESLCEEAPRNPRHRNDLAVGYERLGDILADRGRTDEARDFYEKKLKVALDLVAAEPSHPGFRHSLALTYWRLERFEEGEKILARLIEDEPANLTYLDHHASFWSSIRATIDPSDSAERHRAREAAASHAKALDRLAARLTELDRLPAAFDAHEEATEALGAARDFAAAEFQVAKLRDLAARIAGDEATRSDYALRCDRVLAGVAYVLGYDDRAEQLYRQLANATEATTDDHRLAEHRYRAFYRLGRLAMMRDDWPAARDLFEESLRANELALMLEGAKQHYVLLLQLHDRRVEVFRQLGQTEDAIAAAHAAVEVCRRMLDRRASRRTEAEMAERLEACADLEEAAGENPDISLYRAAEIWKRLAAVADDDAERDRAERNLDRIMTRRAALD